MRSSLALWLMVSTLGCSRATPPVPVTDLAVTPQIAPITKPSLPAILGKEGDIPLTTLDGKDSKLSDHGAKVTVIAMWATFCAPCLQELPQVEALYQRYKSDPEVSILAISVDDINSPKDLERVAGVAKKLGLTLPVLIAKDEALSKRFTRTGETDQGLPMFITIDSQLRFHRDMGFNVSLTKDEFVKQRSEGIELARKGQLVEDEPISNSPAGDEGGHVTMTGLSPNDLNALWPMLRKDFKSKFKLTDKVLDQMKKSADAQAKKGEPVSFDLPEKHAPAK